MTSMAVVDGSDVSVLTLGVNFTYTIPSFSAIQVSLRQATIQVELPDGSGQLFDGFLQSHSSLPVTSSTSPFCITITKHCFVPVEEFCKVVYVRHLRAVKDHGLLVVMEWTKSGYESASEGSGDEGPSSIDTSSESDQHGGQSFVDFKCIGVTREPVYQTILSDVRDIIQSGGTVDVKLMPEPDNPFDANAIAFQCLHQSKWKTIGYVVAEVCSEVLAAIESDNIISVKFSWVKYKLWKKSPGFYASIRITRHGEWSKKVIECRNTFS